MYHITLQTLYRPLSRRLEHHDHVIQNESRDPFGGRVIPRQMSRFLEIPTHFILGSCSILFSVLPNYPYEQIQNLSFLLQIVFLVKIIFVTHGRARLSAKIA